MATTEPAAAGAAALVGGVLGPGAAAGDPEGAEMVLSVGAGAAAFFVGAGAGAALAGAGAGALVGVAVAGAGATTGAASGAICTGDGAIAGAPLGACAVAATARTAKTMAAMTEREADIFATVRGALRRAGVIAGRVGVEGFVLGA